MEFVMVYEKVYQERVYADGTKKSVLRLVRWNSQRPYVENREFLLDEKKEWRPGKARGMTAAEIDILLAKKDQLAEDFKRAEGVAFNRR